MNIESKLERAAEYLNGRMRGGPCESRALHVGLLGIATSTALLAAFQLWSARFVLAFECASPALVVIETSVAVLLPPSYLALSAGTSLRRVRAGHGPSRSLFVAEAVGLVATAVDVWSLLHGFFVGFAWA